MKLATLLLVNIIAQLTAFAQQKPLNSYLKIDHINIAVQNIDSAENLLNRKFGFSIKKGRLHKNSILNAFAKLQDGTMVELITASDSIDMLSKQYLDTINKNPSGKTCFIALRVNNLTDIVKLTKSLQKLDLTTEYVENNFFSVLSIIDKEKYYPVFFIHYKKVQTDKKSNLTHKNSAVSLNKTWLKVNNKDRVIKHLLNTQSSIKNEFHYGMQTTFSKISLQNSTLNFYYYSGATELVGISLLVNSLEIAKQYFEDQLDENLTFCKSENCRSIYIEPKHFFGLWLELIQREK